MQCDECLSIFFELFCMFLSRIYVICSIGLDTNRLTIECICSFVSTCDSTLLRTREGTRFFSEKITLIRLIIWIFCLICYSIQDSTRYCLDEFIKDDHFSCIIPCHDLIIDCFLYSCISLLDHTQCDLIHEGRLDGRLIDTDRGSTRISSCIMDEELLI